MTGIDSTKLATEDRGPARPVPCGMGGSDGGPGAGTTGPADPPDFDRDFSDSFVGLSPRESGRLIRDLAAERDRLEAVRRAAAECVAAEVGSFAWYSAYHELSHALDRLALVRAGLERGREFAGPGAEG